MPTKSFAGRTLTVVCSMMLTLSYCHQLTARSDTTEEVEEIEQTRNIHVQVNGQNVFSTLVNGSHEPSISIYLIFKNIPYNLDLTLNNYLLSQTYKEKIINASSVVYRYVNQSQEMCYYHGAIHNEVHSAAAFSTCEGIKGFFVLNDSTFHIKPLQLDDSTLVGLYEIQKTKKDNLSQWVCGIDELEHKFDEVTGNQRVKRQIIADSLDGMNVIELYIANDERRFKYFNGDVNALSKNTREIVNTANLLYQPVGFFIVLVGVEHWQTDQIDVVIDAAVAWRNWTNYRANYILNNSYNDVGFLITGQTFANSTGGIADYATMCRSRTSSGIAMGMSGKSTAAGTILAHEIGHLLGVSHDTSNCYCESSKVSCIMSRSMDSSIYFSSCSKAQLILSLSKGIDICLKDFPWNQADHYQVCGNGILEQGEDCDCGRIPPEQCNPNCCNSSTCKLVGSAQCASGVCCEVNLCQLKRANVICRAVIGPCDLQETCDGSSAFCPKNIYKHDGMNCSVDGVNAYCWQGMCRTQRSQCKVLYGWNVLESNFTCYQTYNILGNESGWCSVIFTEVLSYNGCQTEDVMCGALQCNSNTAPLVRYASYKQAKNTINKFECRASVMDYGRRVENPGMVPNGASCGSGKMCVSAKCVSAQSKLLENPCPSCVHGVCTNEGTCQCVQSYWGPNCEYLETTEAHPTTAATIFPDSSSTTIIASTRVLLPGIIFSIIYYLFNFRNLQSIV